MRKLIQLDPKKAPLHPMLGVTKRAVIKRQDIPLGKGELSEFIENVRFFLGGSDFSVVAMGDAREVLNRYSFKETRFLNFSDDYWIQNSLTVDGGIQDESIKNFVQLVDLSTGKQFTGNVPDSLSIVDITGLKPFQPLDLLESTLYLFRLDTFLGVDVNWVLLLQLGTESEMSPEKLSILETATIRLMNHILSDYKFQKELAIRDYNYKAALLDNLISSQPLLHYYLEDEKDRSKSVYSFVIKGEDSKWFYQKLFELGFEIGKTEKENGNEYYSIANFINHSKEQIELFVDKVSDLFK